jgi:hypothetical protein
MSRNGKSLKPHAVDEDFLITETAGGSQPIVERTLTVQSIPLPEANIAEVDRIQISEKVILVPLVSRGGNKR